MKSLKFIWLVVFLLCCFLIAFIYCCTGGGTSYEYPSSEKLISTNALDCFNPSLAWSGNKYCASWQGNFDFQGLDMEIGYRKLDADGGGIGSDYYIVFKGDSEAPKVVWNGTDFWIAWANSPDGGLNCEIYMHRVGGGFTVYQITNSPGDDRYPSITWTGDCYGLCWAQQDIGSGGKIIHFNIISADGTTKLLPEDTLVNENSGQSACYPCLVWNGDGYGVCWEDDREGQPRMYFARLDKDGSKIGNDVPISSSALVLDPNRPSSSLVWNGSQYAVTWDAQKEGGHYQIYMALISSDGEKLGGDIQVTTSESTSIRPSIVWAGDKYGIAWEDNRTGQNEIFMAYLDEDGNKLEDDHQVSHAPAVASYPYLLWNGSKCVVLWMDMRDEDGEIYFCY
jgi:hypothetical protein